MLAIDLKSLATDLLLIKLKLLLSSQKVVVLI